MALSDRRLLAQAVTNLVKNASEAIELGRRDGRTRARSSGRIAAKVRTKGRRRQIAVIDNGCGLPKENRERLVEPYMTTREKGTGLGLAIVQRITEQHGGTLTLADAPKRTARSKGPRCGSIFRWARGKRRARRGHARAGRVRDVEDSRTYGHEAEEEEGVTHGV